MRHSISRIPEGLWFGVGRLRWQSHSSMSIHGDRIALQHAVLDVLTTSDPTSKMTNLLQLVGALNDGALAPLKSTPPTTGIGIEFAPVPDHPQSPAEPPLMPPNRLGRPKGVPLNVYMLHSLAHIEMNAVQMYADTVARFLPDASLPRQLFVDCLRIAADEATHFGWLTHRLRQLGSRYGALPAHDGLWRDALATKDSLPARLVILPLVAESRALDSEERLVAKLRSVGDPESAGIVGRICAEEVRHVAMGVTWFTWLCHNRREGDTADPAQEFQRLVRQYVKTPLPPPFNEEARLRAGLPREWYLPVSKQPTNAEGAAASVADTSLR